MIHYKKTHITYLKIHNSNIFSKIPIEGRHVPRIKNKNIKRLTIQIYIYIYYWKRVFFYHKNRSNIVPNTKNKYKKIKLRVASDI